MEKQENKVGENESLVSWGCPGRQDALEFTEQIPVPFLPCGEDDDFAGTSDGRQRRVADGFCFLPNLDGETFCRGRGCACPLKVRSEGLKQLTVGLGNRTHGEPGPSQTPHLHSDAKFKAQVQRLRARGWKGE